MKCPICGFENPKGVRFCGYCGEELPPPPPGYIPQTQGSLPEIASPQQTPIRLGTYWKILVAVVVVIVLIAIIAALIMTFAGSGPHLKITSWTPTNAAMFVLFSVQVSNTGHESGSATVHCTVTFGNGDSYSGTQAISLGPGESTACAVTVIIPYSHMLDTTGEYSCTLS